MYSSPQKLILTRPQLAYFQDSEPHKIIIGYIESLNQAILSRKLTDDCPQGEGLVSALRLLDKIEQLIKDTPIEDNKLSRFGNPAFKTFYDKVSMESPLLHESIPGLPLAAIPEVTIYFNESWGNRARIDYGSGMELNFLCWIICLERLGVFTESDHQAIVLKLFWRYISVMRVVQSTYWLEPAGSHGVWGLDDYHFLPFLWGSAQLRGHKYIKPKSIHDPDTVDEYSKDYMYLACIKFVNSIKTASLRWHSPMLDDISAVKTWDKVNEGMIKMYKAEVLAKLPVMQHFLFGTILPLSIPESLRQPSSSYESSAPVGGSHDGHTHPHARHIHPKVLAQQSDLGGAGQLETGWGDCCGIHVPSAFAAAEDEKQKASGNVTLSDKSSVGILNFSGAVRPVPFD